MWLFNERAIEDMTRYIYRVTTKECYLVDFNDLFYISNVDIMGHNRHHSYLWVWYGDNRHHSSKGFNTHPLSNVIKGYNSVGPSNIL